jgi:hypothetical protein
VCIVILTTASFMLESDGHASRGSIVAMTEGHFLPLSLAQANMLAAQFDRASNTLSPRGLSGPWPGSWPGIPVHAVH